GTAGTVETFYFVGEESWTAERLAALPAVDAVIRLSRELARIGIYPCIDAIVSRSRVLDAGLVGEEHAVAAARGRARLTAALAAPEGTDLVVKRARKLQRFFAQPFFVAEPYTRRPGIAVGRAESLRVCREILDGVHDDVPEEAFYFTGGIDEVRARAARS